MFFQKEITKSNPANTFLIFDLLCYLLLAVPEKKMNSSLVLIKNLNLLSTFYHEQISKKITHLTLSEEEFLNKFRGDIYPNLVSLTLKNVNDFDKSCLGKINKLTRLKTIELCLHRIDSQKIFESLDRLDERIETINLELDECELPRNQKFLGLKKLKKLSLLADSEHFVGYYNLDLGFLRNAENLIELELWCPNSELQLSKDYSINVIKELKNLESLKIEGFCTDDLEFLNCFPNLNRLKVTYVLDEEDTLSNEMLDCILKLEKLKHLSLSYFTDIEEKLSQLKNIETLSIEIMDQDISFLGGMESLKKLSVSYDYTRSHNGMLPPDEGTALDLSFLKNFKHLKIFHLKDYDAYSGIDFESVKNIKKTNPHLTIQGINEKDILETPRATFR